MQKNSNIIRETLSWILRTKERRRPRSGWRRNIEKEIKKAGMTGADVTKTAESLVPRRSVLDGLLYAPY